MMAHSTDASESSSEEQASGGKKPESKSSACSLPFVEGDFLVILRVGLRFELWGKLAFDGRLEDEAWGASLSDGRLGVEAW